MPAIRTMPAAKPLRTERTHEENQERAYIAASRRSDRSLEARVESARRASEIHKKRTGRSLRVREEDVLNEEMYEEEDDDLPMQYRRINALNPHLSYAFAERLNNYVNGQIGVRTALQQAIAQSNQYQQNQQLLNSYMQSSGCYSGSPTTPAAPAYPSSPWPMNNMQSMPSNFHNRSPSMASPHEAYPQSTPNSAMSPNGFDARRMSLPVHAMNNVAIPRRTSTSPKQIPSPPRSVAAVSPNLSKRPSRPAADAQMAPLTTQLPNETLQMLHGASGFNHAFFPSEFNATSPSMTKYSYNPNGNKTSSHASSAGSEKANPFDGLNQTLSPSALSSFPSFADTMSASHAQSNREVTFDSNAYPSFAGLAGGEYYNSQMDFGSDGNPADDHTNSFVSPSDNLDANFGDFFDFQTTPE